MALRSVQLSCWLSSLGGALYRLQREGLLCDVTIETEGGGKIHAHSVILAAGSSVLMETMVNQNRTGFKVKAMTISSEFPVSVWTPLLKFLYTGHLDLAPHTLPQLHRLARMLHITKLTAVLKPTPDSGNDTGIHGGENGNLTSDQPADLSAFFSSHFGDLDGNHDGNVESEVVADFGRNVEVDLEFVKTGGVRRGHDDNTVDGADTNSNTNDSKRQNKLNTTLPNNLLTESQTQNKQGKASSNVMKTELVEEKGATCINTKLNNDHVNQNLTDNVSEQSHSNIVEESHSNGSSLSTLSNDSDEPPLIATSLYKCALCGLTFQSFQSLVLHSDLCQNSDINSDIEEDERNELITGIGYKTEKTKVIFEGSVSVKAVEMKASSHKVISEDNEQDRQSHETNKVDKRRQKGETTTIVAVFTDDTDKGMEFSIKTQHESRDEDHPDFDANKFLQELQATSEGEDLDQTSSEDLKLNEGIQLSTKKKKQSRKSSAPKKRKTELKLEKENIKMRKTKDKNAAEDDKSDSYSSDGTTERNKKTRTCCDVCGACLSSKMALREHMNLHHEDQTYQCKKCLKTFQTKRYLYKHEKFVHDKETKTHHCELCPKTFQVKSHLTTHVKYDHCQDPGSEALNRCELCNKTFRYPILLKQHVLTHSNDLQFVCSLCDKGFLTKHYLERHMLTHVDVTPWSCQHCDKKFKYKSSLAHHTQTTCSQSSKAEASSFPCEICERVFSEKKNMTAHVKQVHLGMKKFMCKICDRAFSRNSTLKCHMFNIHERQDKKDNNPPTINHQPPVHHNHQPPVQTTIRMAKSVVQVGVFDENKFMENVIKQEVVTEDFENDMQKASEPVRNIVNKFVKIKPKPELTIIATCPGEEEFYSDMNHLEGLAETQVEGQEQILEHVIDENGVPIMTEVVTQSSQILTTDTNPTQDESESLIKPMSIKLAGIVPLSELSHKQQTQVNVVSVNGTDQQCESPPPAGPDCLVTSIDGGMSVTNSIVSSEPGLQFVNPPQTSSIEFSNNQICGINLPQIANGVMAEENMTVQQPLNLSLQPNHLNIHPPGVTFHNQLNLSQVPAFSQVSIAHITHTQPIFVKSLSSSSVVITNTGPPTKDFDDNPDDTERNELYFVDHSIVNQSNDLSILNGADIGSDDSYVKNKLDYSLFSLSSLGKTPDKL